MITDQQVRILRLKLKQGHTQQAAAAAAAMSERSARKYKDGPLPSLRTQPRHWRTRTDPFEHVFDEHLVPLLQADRAGDLRAPTLLAMLNDRTDFDFPPSTLRTLQRLIARWRSLHGPAKTVVFEQLHPPGREASIDFTHASTLGVTINLEPLDHLLFTFKLSHSGWTWLNLAPSESFEALVAGVQGALFALGGVPHVLHHDNLSAATHELRKTKGRKLNARFQDFCDHFGLESVRINPGQSHENGVVERAHSTLKSCLRQQLILRGHADFDSPEAYLEWARGCLARHINTPDVLEKRDAELELMKTLPAHRYPEYSEYQLKIRRTSTIKLVRHHYSLPSRLIGQRVCARVFPAHIEVWLGQAQVASFPRSRGNTPQAHIDYRHVIDSLVRKPGAFARYKWRAELFPSLTFRRAYDAMVAQSNTRADPEYVRILALAARTMESSVEVALELLLESGERIELMSVEALVVGAKPEIPDVAEVRLDLSQYDALLGGLG